MEMHLMDLAVRREDANKFLVKAEFGFGADDDFSVVMIHEFDRPQLERWLAAQAYINAEQRADFARWLDGQPQAVPAGRGHVTVCMPADGSIN